MQKLYGDQIRGEAGLTKILRSAATTIPKTIPERLQELVKRAPVHDSQKNHQDHSTNATDILKKVERSIEETITSATDTMPGKHGLKGGRKEGTQGTYTILHVRTVKPGLKSLLQQTKDIMEEPPLPELQHNGRSSPPLQHDSDNSDPRYQLHNQQRQWSLGTPVKVDWEIKWSSADQIVRHHDDWIGIYKISPPVSTISPPASPTPAAKKFTTISSNGRWMWLNGDEKNKLATVNEETIAATAPGPKKGTITFKGAQLPWEVGFYEARLHYGTSHLVLAVSEPFEITGK
jgi:phosphatidylethanolamine N-methyltransferase